MEMYNFSIATILIIGRVLDSTSINKQNMASTMLIVQWIDQRRSFTTASPLSVHSDGWYYQPNYYASLQRIYTKEFPPSRSFSLFLINIYCTNNKSSVCLQFAARGSGTALCSTGFAFHWKNNNSRLCKSLSAVALCVWIGSSRCFDWVNGARIVTWF